MKRKQRIVRKTRQTAGHPREGSVIVVVLALTIGLLFLGILLYTDAAQEDINAEYFAKGARIQENEVSPDRIAFDPLRQIVIGASLSEKHSPFYGGRLSLIPGIYGQFRPAYGGQGVHLTNVSGAIVVDNDYNGVADPTASNAWWQLNQSVAATREDRATLPAANSRFFMNFPAPNPGYTYPDNNSPFLHYESWVRNPSTGTLTKVMIPSYMRPQILRTLGVPPSEWYSNATTAPHMIRPHMEHRALISTGAVATRGGVEVRRFISAAYPEAGVSPFPFPKRDPSDTGNVSGPQMGIWTSNGNTYMLDVDLDGDGVKESIYMDMDLGIFSTPDGTKKFVPIVAAKLVPLDSLFDLNNHGNIAKAIDVNGHGQPFLGAAPYTTFMHNSNQAVNRSEINPMYAWLMLTSPGSGADTEQHRRYWQRDPQSLVDLANMEHWWLKTGRPEFQGSSIQNSIAGVYGEPNLMMLHFNNPNNLAIPPYPAPGRTHGAYFYPQSHPLAGQVISGDDNNNGASGAAFSDNTPFTPVGIERYRVFPPQVVFPRYGTPLDYRSHGHYIENATQRELQTVGRHKFEHFHNYYGQVPNWPTALLPGFGAGAIIDEPDEMYTETAYLSSYGYDRRLPASQTSTLHMSNSQLSATNNDNDPVIKLAPMIFQNDPNAQNLRRFFTTRTANLKAYGFTRRFGYRDGEFERTVVNGQTVDVFPARFAGGALSAAKEPFRQEVRDLMGMIAGNSTLLPLQRKLNLNEILDRYPPVGHPSNTPFPGQLRFRPLTAHVLGTQLGNSPVSGVTGVNYPEDIGIDPATRYARQEWLARYDRQRLCRDIYMLLYLTGGGSDAINYANTDNSTGQVYTNSQLKDMAQFAVNLVDARDEDDVITVFEYDRNPLNGWDLDDNPFTNEGALTDRAVVFGVERQQLTFSEAMSVFAKQVDMQGMAGTPADHGGTDYDDKKNHVYSYVELQNVSPKAVSFANSAWQIVVKDPRTAPLPTAPLIVERRLTLLPNAVGVSAAANGSDQNSRFTIGTQDDPSFDVGPGGAPDGVRDPSYFNANPKYKEMDDPTTFTRLIPRVGLSLDLMQNASLASYRLTRNDGSTVTSTMLSPSGRELVTILNADSIDATTNLTVHLELRRRLHPYRVGPNTLEAVGTLNFNQQNADNPWVTVDTMDIPLTKFILAHHNVDTKQFRDELLKLRSAQRIQPLMRIPTTNPLWPLRYPITGIDTSINPPDPTIYRLNSFHTVNRQTQLNLTNGVFTLYHPHPDRPFSSVSELLPLPLYGPDEVTAMLGTPSTSNSKLNLSNTAISRFLRPDLPVSSMALPLANPGNRWHRLLGLVEPTPRTPGQYPWFINRLGLLGSPRYHDTSGEMNLNTMIHPAHLAGLLDAPDFLKFNPNGPRYLDDTYTGLATTRDWWDQFLRSRDGIDPITGLTLPGVPGASNPFRDLTDKPDTSGSTPVNRTLEHTVLRSLPQDGNTRDGRRLFEIGSKDQHDNWQNHQNIDATTRYRLFNKVLNNTTNRGNVFLLILRVEYFEAVEVDTDVAGEKAIRIGAKLPGNQSPDTTTYYVLDRSRAFNGISQIDFPKRDPNTGEFTWSFRQNMYYRRFVLDQQRVD